MQAIGDGRAAEAAGRARTTWMPRHWLGEVRDPVAVVFVEGEDVARRGFAPGDILICDAAARPAVGEIVAFHWGVVAPDDDAGAAGGRLLVPTTAIGIYDGERHDWHQIIAQIDGLRIRAGIAPCAWRDTLIGVHRRTLSGEGRGAGADQPPAPAANAA